MRKLINYIQLFYAKSIFYTKKYFTKSKQMQQLQQNLETLFNAKIICAPLCVENIVTSILCDISLSGFVISYTFTIVGSNLSLNINSIKPTTIPADEVVNLMNKMYSAQTQNTISQLIRPYIGTPC